MRTPLFPAHIVSSGSGRSEFASKFCSGVKFSRVEWSEVNDRGIHRRRGPAKTAPPKMPFAAHNSPLTRTRLTTTHNHWRPQKRQLLAAYHCHYTAASSGTIVCGRGKISKKKSE